jgi:predicted nucleic acid-binding protein
VTTYVLDASAGTDLLLDTSVGRSLIPRLQAGAQWWVPEHYFVEVAAVLRRAELAGSIDEATARRACDSLATAPLRRAQVRPLLTDAWSKRANITIHDALYVVLAEHLHAVLVTTDRRLANVHNLTVEVISP